MCLILGIPFLKRPVKTDDIYSKTLSAVADGANVVVSLATHSLVVDGMRLIDHGQWQGELGLVAVGEDVALAMIEEAYAAYESSVPAHGGNEQIRWFHARSIDQLTDHELATGMDRSEARCRLEVLVLLLILNGSLTTDGPKMKGKWFWQSKRHPQLVILTEWIKTDINQ